MTRPYPLPRGVIQAERAPVADPAETVVAVAHPKHGWTGLEIAAPAAEILPGLLDIASDGGVTLAAVGFRWHGLVRRVGLTPATPTAPYVRHRLTVHPDRIVVDAIRRRDDGSEASYRLADVPVSAERPALFRYLKEPCTEPGG